MAPVRATQLGSTASSWAGSTKGHDSLHQGWPYAVLHMSRPRRRHATAIRALHPGMAMPVVTEVAKRAMAATAAGSVAGTSAATLTHMMHHQTLMFFSLLGTLSVSFGAWTIALARFVWQQWGESYIFKDGTVQEKEFLYGVDVTGSTFLTRAAVIAAADFANDAHQGQMRRTGDPYIMHCIETGCIVEGLLNTSEYAEDDERSELSVIAALLHDVVDDTRVDISEVDAAFGQKAAMLVGTVTKLSQMNQLMRRKQRKAREAGTAEAKPMRVEENELRDLILTMVDEPLAILIKLADRLHNMRTVWALEPKKAQAVAMETLRIWCSLAERLGMFALKSELEDLCFAVLKPDEFQKLRHDLDMLWGCSHKAQRTPPVSLPPKPKAAAANSAGSRAGRNSPPRRLLDRKAISKDRKRWPNNPFQLNATGVEASTSAILASVRQVDDAEADALAAAARSANARDSDVAAVLAARKPRPPQLSKEQRQIKALVESVQPFDQLMFKSHHRVALSSARRRGLEVIDRCGRQLLQELRLNGQATGLDINIQGRLKSLHSTHNKMQRKGVALEEIYDARALRVVIDDGGVRNSEEAIAACYQVRSAVQRLWKPIAKEGDDYIANPKGSGGYQSLHMAVVGPGGVPMEVQLRTSSMHADAEYGAAAHWVYKEAVPAVPGADGGATVRVGQPVLRVDPDGALQDGLILEVEREGAQLLVALCRRGRLSGASGSGRADSKAYRRLKAYIDVKGWSMPGQCDGKASLHTFVKCRDGAYHMQDQYGFNWPITAVPLQDLPPQVVDQNPVALAPPPKRPISPEPAMQASPLSQLSGGIPAGAQAAPTETDTSAEARRLRSADQRHISHKTRFLRGLLEWGEELDGGLTDGAAPSSADVVILTWPPATLHRIPRGTTAGHVIKTHGLLQLSDRRDPSGLVNVNNRLVPDTTQLQDGDLVMLADELVQI